MTEIAGGKMVIISAPSGAGKTTIVRYLLTHVPNLQFSISATTRSKRAHEKDGVDYHFISKEEFLHQIANKAFIEFEEVYPDRFYGTLRSSVQEIWSNNKHVIFDIDVQGGLHLKKKYGERALSIFIEPPSMEVLEERLIGRGTDKPEELAIRMAKAKEECSFSSQFDVVIHNDNLDEACRKTTTLVADFLS